MVRRLFRDSAIYIIPAALSSGVSFFMFPFYAHHFTPREYGLLDLLMLAGMLVGWTVALEIYQAIGVFVAGEKNGALARRFASTGLWFAVGAYAVFAVVAELLATPISHAFLGHSVNVILIRVAVPLMCCQGVLMIAQSQLRWQLRPVPFAAGALINVVLTVVASAALVFGAHLEVEGAILGQLIGCTAALAYSALATRGSFRLHFDLAECRRMLAYSIPLVPSSVAVFLNLYTDRIVIQHVRSISDVGVYGVGYRLAMIVQLLLLGFQGAALPLILARRDEPSTPGDLARSLRIFAAVALSMLVLLTILATPALRVLAAARYQRASWVVPLLVVAVLFAGMYNFAPGPAIAKKSLSWAAVTILAGLANVALALLLVPPLGIVGAGVATAITSVAWFAALLALSQHYYPVPHDWRQLITAFATVSLFVGLSLAILPADRAHALSPSTLAVRGVLVVTGVALSVRLALGSRDMEMFRRVVSGLAARVRVRVRPTIRLTD